MDTRELRRRLDGLRRDVGCQHCGRRHGLLNRLEFAHLAPTPISAVARGRGLRDRYFDVRRNRAVYCVLCRDCHLRLDSGQWGPVDLALVRANAAPPAVWDRWLGSLNGNGNGHAVGPITVGGSTMMPATVEERDGDGGAAGRVGGPGQGAVAR